MEFKETTCHGCGRKTKLGVAHCVYPSNPDFNAAHPKKRDDLSTLPVVIERRERARAITRQNRREV